MWKRNRQNLHRMKSVSSPSETSRSVVNTQKAPKPVGAYPHARRVGDLLFLSGVGPRQPGTDAIPGGPIRDADKNPLDYDAAAQTRAVIENIRIILEASGSSLDRVIDVQAFLIDMDRDFQATTTRSMRNTLPRFKPLVRRLRFGRYQRRLPLSSR